jgi:MFS family permease
MNGTSGDGAGENLRLDGRSDQRRTAITSLDVVLISLVFSLATSCSCVASVMVAALEVQLLTSGVTMNEIGILSAAYSFPNIILPVIAGHQMDIVGPKPVGTAAMICILAGSIMYALCNSFAGMFAGIFMMGVGATTSVFSIALVAFWFEGTIHQGKSSGVFVLVCNLSKCGAFLSLETIATSTNIDVAKAVGVEYTAACFIFLLIYTWLEQIYWCHLVVDMGRKIERYDCYICQKPKVLDGNALEYEVITAADMQQAATNGDTDDTEDAPSNKPRSGAHIVDAYKMAMGYGALFWLQILTSACGGSVLYAWPAYLQEYLVLKYAFGEDDASYCAALLMAMFLVSPIGGWITDRFGNRLHVQSASLLMIVVGLLVLQHTTLSPWAGELRAGTLCSNITDT